MRQSSLSPTRQGIIEAARLPGLALAATMLGFATMAREAGFSFIMTLTTTAGVWGLPGQVAMVGLLASGGGFLIIFFAVAMANMRMLLMVISASDIMDIKSQKIPIWQHAILFHLLAITGWVQLGYVAPRYDHKQLLAYYLGFMPTIYIMALSGTALGYFIGDLVPPHLLRVVIYITPLYLILLGLSARQLGNRLAVIFGGLFGLVLMPFLGDLAIFVAGFAGGITALLMMLYLEKEKGGS